MIYLLSFLTVFFLSWIAQKAKVEIENTFFKKGSITISHVVYHSSLLLIFVILTSVAGFRYNVGTDYKVYSVLQIPEVLSGITFRVEPLYREVIRIGYSLGSYQWIFVITHVLILVFSILAIKNMSVNIFLSIYVLLMSGFYNNSLNVMRQAIAVSIFLYAVKFIIDRKVLSYLLFIFIAYGFHKTALLFLPIYFIPLIKFNVKRSIFIASLSIFLTPVVRKILVFISGKYGFYSEYFNGLYDRGKSGGVFLILPLLIFICYCILDYYGEIPLERMKQWSFYGNIQLLIIIIGFLFPIIPQSYRLIYMFYPIQIFLVPLMFEVPCNKKIKLFCNVVVLVSFFVFFIYVYIVGQGAETYPYQSIFSVK